MCINNKFLPMPAYNDKNFQISVLELYFSYVCLEIYHMLRLVSFSVDKPVVSQWSRLISPIQDVTEESCLSFLYITSNVHYHVYRYSCTELVEIIRIERFEQLVVWHAIAAKMPAGTYGIIIEARFVQGQEVSDNGIANIILKPGSCERISAGLNFATLSQQHKYYYA